MTKLSSCKLRPHHSLCIQFFEGKGYSEEFVEEMTEIIDALNKSNPILTLTDGCDIICSHCPNRQNEKCVSECKTAKIDGGCLREYGLAYGDRIKWNDLKDLAFKKIIQKNKLRDICLDCQWECFNPSRKSPPPSI